MTQQIEALRLAKELDAYHTAAHHKQAAAELRRLHEVNTALLEALKAILEDMASQHGTDYDYAKARAVIEREACANVCEEQEELRGHTSFDCAAAIRARSNT